MQVERNWHYLKTVCEILLLCTYQEIALRGHREDDTSINKGNFLEILNLVAKHDEIVGNLLNSLPNDTVYMSSKIQNDFIDIMAGMVHSQIVLTVKNAGIFSILVEESNDLSKQEQLVIALRCVHMTLFNIY